MFLLLINLYIFALAFLKLNNKMIKELQNRIRGYLYQYGLGYTAEALGISKYYINKAINETSPDFELLEKLKNHFDNKEAEKKERLEKLLR